MNKNRMKLRNKTYFLTVVIPLAHVYCKTGIANADIRNKHQHFSKVKI